ncbi:Serpentine receptor class gamma [Trichostrongylus colubriformis]|uniref:Serpentine receptor class gamma n=1 Tax=Trichostrongylus colubriformis TaxID=6319 RepID=A0AAN8F4X1_TRICO
MPTNVPLNICTTLRGICDILGIVALEWTRVEDKSSFGPSFELVTRLAESVTGINFFTHILGCFLMTCNRFTAVRFPQQQSHIWCKRNVWASLIVEIVFSVVTHYQAIVMNLVYKPKPDGGWVLNGTSGSVKETRVIDAVIPIVCEIASIVIISYTIYLIHKELQKGNRRLVRDVIVPNVRF